MTQIYKIFLDGKLIGTTKLEKADPPMGVVFGMIESEYVDYEFLKNYCQKNKIDFEDDPDEEFISTRLIESLKVFSPEGVEIVGQGNSIEGMTNEGFEVYLLGVPYPFYEEEFPHHVNSYK